jgi:hypothetical protein
MFPIETLADLRNGSDEETNNWAWLMIVAPPLVYNKGQRIETYIA